MVVMEIKLVLAPIEGSLKGALILLKNIFQIKLFFICIKIAYGWFIWLA